MTERSRRGWLAAAVLALLLGAGALFLATRPRDEPGEAAIAATAPVGAAAGAERGARRGRTVAGPEDVAEQVAPTPTPTGTGFSVEVVDETGARIAAGTLRLDLKLRADVAADAKAALEGLPREVNLATSNPFVVLDLPPTAGEQTVGFRAFPDGRPPAETESVELAHDEVRTLRIVAPVAKTLAVTVVDDATGEPIPGATVISRTEADRRGLRPWEMAGVTGPASAMTGASGVCILDQLGAGPHDLVVRAKGCATTTASDVDAAEAVVRLHRGDTGTVLARCLRPDGTPLAGATLSIRLDDLRADAGGRCRFDDVRSGSVRLCLMDQSIDQPEFGLAPAERRGMWTGERKFELAAGATVEVGIGYVTGDATLEFEIVDADGRARPGVRVWLGDYDVHAWCADTAANGLVRFREIPAGRVQYDVELAPGREAWTTHEAPDLSAGETRRIRLVVGDAVVAGTLVKEPDAAHGRVEVFLLSDELDRIKCVVRDGRFELRDVPPGRYVLAAMTKDRRYSSHDLAVVVGAQSPPPLAVELVPCGTLDVYGHGLSNVRLIDPHGEPAPWIVGTQIPSGPYELEFTREDGTVGRVNVEIRGGEKTEVEAR